MADDPKDPASSAPPEQQLQDVLASRWDPGKMSRFMRGSQGTRSSQLDFSQRSRFEGRLGVDLGAVRIYTGELAEEITRAHSAEALTVGDTGMILMRQSGHFAPGSAAGTALLAHELTHVAQARPSAISFKKTQRDLAQEDESEAEAEETEQQVLQEEKNPGAPAPSAGQKNQNDAERKQKLVEKVMKYWDERKMMDALRRGEHV